MSHLSKSLFLSVFLTKSLWAGTVVVTSIPDDTHPIQPLPSIDGIPLSGDVTIRVGTFSGMGHEALLDTAAAGGYAQIAAALIPFGGENSLGDGAANTPGRFEIAVHQDTSDPTSALIGETISLLITRGLGEEFLVVNFPDITFQPEDATGLDPLQVLHFANAEVVIGNRDGTTKVSTSSAPTSGSFASWIGRFADLTDPADMLPDADPDHDGPSNLLEYATGGNPESGDDVLPLLLEMSEEGSMWVKFPREPGLGVVTFSVESSAALATSWDLIDEAPKSDPNPPVPGSLIWQRIPVPPSGDPQRFFRLSVKSP